LAAQIGLFEFSQYSARSIMNTMVRRFCPLLAREKRSLWLGRSVRGSRTIDDWQRSGGLGSRRLGYGFRPVQIAKTLQDAAFSC
jgi:hypothetical protein